MAKSLQSRILSGSLWSVLGEGVATGGRALAYLFYARLLTPADFGLVAFCLIWVNFFPLVIDNSLGYALIRSQGEDQPTFSVIFLLNLGLSVTGFALLCLAAGPAATLLHDPRAAWILPMIAIQVLFNAGCNTHLSIARRRFSFRKLVPVRLTTTFASAAVGLTLAFLGYGYWSLVAASVAGAAGQMIAAWALLPWRPVLTLDWAAAKPVFEFAPWVGVDMAISWLVMSSGGFFLAFFLGAHDLGLFRLCDLVDMALMGSIFTALIPVFYSAFCEALRGTEESALLFARLSRATTILALILTGGIVLLAHPLQSIIGAKWQGLGNLIALNAVADGISYLTILSPSFMRAQGHTKTIAAIRITLFAGQIIVYGLAAPYGLKAFIFGKIGLEVLLYVITYAVIGNAFSMPVKAIIAEHLGLAAVMTLALAAGTWGASKIVPAGGMMAVGVTAAVFVLMFGGSVLVRERWAGRDLLALLRLR